MKLSRRGGRWLASLAALAIAVAAPAAVMAQSGSDNPVPEDARVLLPESRWAGLYCKEARWQVQAAHDSIDDIETTLNGLDSGLRAINARVDLPDFAAMRARLDALLATVCDAGTARDARDAAGALAERIGQDVSAPMRAFEETLQDRVSTARVELGLEIRTSVNNYFAAERATNETRLRQEFDAQVASRLSQLGRDPTPADIEAAEASARAYVSQLFAQIKIEVETQGQMLAEQLRTDREDRLQAVANELNSLSNRMRSRTAASLSGISQTYRIEALQARRDAILTVIDWRIAQLSAGIRPRMAALPEDQFRAVQLIFDEMAIDRAALSEAIEAAIGANNRGAFDAAVRSFQDSWNQRQTEFDGTRLAATLRCESISDGISAGRDSVVRLRNALPDESELPEVVRANIRAIRSALDEAERAADEFVAACASGDATGAELREIAERLRTHSSTANSELARFTVAVGGGTR